MSNFWKQDWDRVRERLTAWWRGDGFIISIEAPSDRPHEDIPRPARPATLAEAWIDPVYRARQAEYTLSRTYFGAEAFPYFDAHLGPGSLATYLGSEPLFDDETAWYQPCIDDLAAAPPLRFDAENTWFRRQRAILEEGLRLSRGRFLVGMPDLIENMDTVAALRGSEPLMADLLDRPDFVKQKIAEINRVYFEAFDCFYDLIRDEWGGNAFSAFKIWGPGKTIKVQCDASAMFSPKMFAEFVVPALTEQCARMDYVLYHLDGTQAIRHLDNLLAMDAIDAIEWTPQAGIETGGSPRWYDLYRRILKAGKRVQAVGVEPHEIIPLLEAVGPDGLFIISTATSERQAREVVDRAEAYR